MQEFHSIIAPNIIQTNDNKAQIDFSIAHEFAHMIQDFIFSSKINLENISKEKYEKEINIFFGVNNIKITEKQFDAFKEFLKENLLGNKAFVKIMKFDDAHYVSLQDAYDKSFMGLLSRLYYNNSNEIHANIFATDMIVQKYKDEKQPNELMQQLLEKINKHFQYINIEKSRDKDLFKKQIEITKKYKQNTKRLYKTKNKKHNTNTNKIFCI